MLSSYTRTRIEKVQIFLKWWVNIYMYSVAPKWRHKNLVPSATWTNRAFHSVQPANSDWLTDLAPRLSNKLFFLLFYQNLMQLHSVKPPLRATPLQWPLFHQVDCLYIRSYFNYSTVVSSNNWQGPLKCIPTAKRSSWEWPVNQWLLKCRMVHTKPDFLL